MTSQTSPLPLKTKPLSFFENRDEIENVLLKHEGEVPSWLSGQLIRNGPGIFKNKEHFIDHWFDGLAKLHSFTFIKGQVSYTCKFLKSTAYEKFQSTEEFDFSGFSQQPLLNKFSLFKFILGHKNQEITNANVNIAKLNNTLIALTEIPLPVEFDENLDTKGSFEYSDTLPKNYSYESAHLLIDPQTQNAWNFLIDIGLWNSSYKIYKILHGSSTRTLIASIPVSKISYMHSFSLAGKYFILIDYPLRSKNITQNFIKSFQWDSTESCKVYVIDRESGKHWSFVTAAFFSFHHINGFEKEGKIYVDLIAYPSADIIYKVNTYPLIDTPQSHLLRLEMDIRTGQIKKNILSLFPIEFPRVNDSFTSHPYQYFYAVYSKEKSQGLAKYDHEKQHFLTWHQDQVYANEPIFMAHPQARSEDDGVVLSVINDLKSKKSYLLILNAQDFKEIARLEAPHLIPFGFHGQFFKKEVS